MMHIVKKIRYVVIQKLRQKIVRTSKRQLVMVNVQLQAVVAWVVSHIIVKVLLLP